MAVPKTKKPCVICGVVKPRSEFGLRNGDKWALPACKECLPIYWKQYGTPASHRDSNLKSRLRISLERYRELYNQQNGMCLGCGKHFDENNHSRNSIVIGLNVDHDHATGRVRGLLCGPCNLVLGHSHDDPEVLRNLASYLERDV